MSVYPKPSNIGDRYHDGDVLTGAEQIVGTSTDTIDHSIYLQTTGGAISGVLTASAGIQYSDGLQTNAYKSAYNDDISSSKEITDKMSIISGDDVQFAGEVTVDKLLVERNGEALRMTGNNATIGSYDSETSDQWWYIGNIVSSNPHKLYIKSTRPNGRIYLTCGSDSSTYTYQPILTDSLGFYMWRAGKAIGKFGGSRSGDSNDNVNFYIENVWSNDIIIDSKNGDLRIEAGNGKFILENNKGITFESTGEPDSYQSQAFTDEHADAIEMLTISGNNISLPGKLSLADDLNLAVGKTITFETAGAAQTQAFTDEHADAIEMLTITGNDISLPGKLSLADDLNLAAGSVVAFKSSTATTIQTQAFTDEHEHLLSLISNPVGSELTTSGALNVPQLRVENDGECIIRLQGPTSSIKAYSDEGLLQYFIGTKTAAPNELVIDNNTSNGAIRLSPGYSGAIFQPVVIDGGGLEIQRNGTTIAQLAPTHSIDNTFTIKSTADDLIFDTDFDVRFGGAAADVIFEDGKQLVFQTGGVTTQTQAFTDSHAATLSVMSQTGGDVGFSGAVTVNSNSQALKLAGDKITFNDGTTISTAPSNSPADNLVVMTVADSRYQLKTQGGTEKLEVNADSILLRRDDVLYGELGALGSDTLTLKTHNNKNIKIDPGTGDVELIAKTVYIGNSITDGAISMRGEVQNHAFTDAWRTALANATSSKVDMEVALGTTSTIGQSMTSSSTNGGGGDSSYFDINLGLYFIAESAEGYFYFTGGNGTTGEIDSSDWGRMNMTCSLTYNNTASEHGFVYRLQSQLIIKPNTSQGTAPTAYISPLCGHKCTNAPTVVYSNITVQNSAWMTYKPEYESQFLFLRVYWHVQTPAVGTNSIKANIRAVQL